MDKTVFFSESGSWDNMVNLSTKSFPGAHILVGARKVRVHASKNASPTGFASKAVLAGAYKRISCLPSYDCVREVVSVCCDIFWLCKSFHSVS